MRIFLSCNKKHFNLSYTGIEWITGLLLNSDAEVLFPEAVNLSKNPSDAAQAYLCFYRKEIAWHICPVRQASGASLTK